MDSKSHFVVWPAFFEGSKPCRVHMQIQADALEQNVKFNAPFRYEPFIKKASYRFNGLFRIL